MERSAQAIWSGPGKDGTGHLTTDSKTLNNTSYSFHSRFEDGTETNPEELIAAAHAGCFNMKLSFVLGNSDFVPESLDTTCTLTMTPDGTVTLSKLTLRAKVPGLGQELFEEAVKDAEVNCPISVLLNTKIEVDAQLV